MLLNPLNNVENVLWLSPVKVEATYLAALEFKLF